MCMKNVNATLFLTTNVEALDNGIRSLGAVFDGIVPKSDDRGYYLSNFNIVLNCSIMYNTANESDKIAAVDDGSFALDKCYEFLVRFTHVESGVGITMDTFELMLDRNKLKTWCKAFYEFKRFIKVPHLLIPKGLGNYAIKLLIREKSDDKDAPWITQTLTSLVVGDRYQ